MKGGIYLKKSSKQEKIENQFQVLQLWKILIGSWVAKQLNKGLSLRQIGQKFIVHCRRAKIPIEEIRRMMSYLRMAARKEKVKKYQNNLDRD